MKIGRTYRFEAAHWLPAVPEGHKCRNMHGHNYRVDIVLDGAVGDDGFVVDFADIDRVMDPLIRLVDNRVLNEISKVAKDCKLLNNPTAENIAVWFRTYFAEHFTGNNITVRTCQNPRCCFIYYSSKLSGNFYAKPVAAVFVMPNITYDH